jgi:exopolysaccharide biosynthesis polyprenyl glycosylphosphotransferase
MLKNRHEGLFFLHGVTLNGLVLVWLWAAYGICHWSGVIEFNQHINWSLYSLAVVAAMAWNQYALRGVGDRLATLDAWSALKLTLQQATRVVAVVFTLAYVTRDVEMSRAFLGFFLGGTGALLFVCNYYIAKKLCKFLFRGLKLRTLVLAHTEDAGRLASWFSQVEHLGQVMVGWISKRSEVNPVHTPGIPWLGNWNDLEQVMAEHNINHLMVNRSYFDDREASRIEQVAERRGCRLHYFIDLGEAFGTGVTTLEHTQRYAFASHTNEPLDNPANRFAKRALDLAISVPVVIFVLPVLTALVWAYQRKQSPGPIFHRQERSGLNRERFHIFKFRTMHVRQGPCDQAKQATANDQRVFPFGRTMRRTSLDEFPQFINVLLGQMSVSGPRPHLIEHDARFAEIVDNYYRRHFVKPGITGLAQSSGFRGEISGDAMLEQRVAYDLRYVTRWSLMLDLKIIFATAWQVLVPPKSAY